MGKHIYIASVRNCGREELARRYIKEKGNANAVCLMSSGVQIPWTESCDKAKIDDNTVFIWDSLERTQKDFVWKYKKFVHNYPKNDIIILSSCNQQRFSKEIQQLLKFHHFEYYYFPDPTTFPERNRQWLIDSMIKNIFDPPKFTNIKRAIIMEDKEN